MQVIHTIRTPNGLKRLEITRASAIRQFCYECMGWSKAKVKLCTVPDCPLYPFRLTGGYPKDPDRPKGDTPEHLREFRFEKGVDGTR